MNSIFSRIMLLLALMLLFASCDKEVNDIGANVLGDDHYGFESYTDASIVAFTQNTDAVQTNNNSINQLGIYDNPVFGKTIASFATQLQLETLNPVIIGETGVEIYLDIPYLEPTATATSTAGSSTYELNNVIGDKTSKIKLSVFRISKQFDKFDSDRNGESKNYYSNDNIDATIIGTRLNDGASLSENDEFVLDKSERTITTTATPPVTTYSPPTLRLKLNNSLLADLKATASTNLANQFDFSKFYRGLYFKVEQSGSNAGFLTLLNFKAGKIKITYKGQTSSTAPAIEDKLITLGFGSTASPVISINILQQTNNSNYANALANPNKIIGDEKLFIKGGNGSVAMIDLFGKDLYGADGVSGTPNRIADELDIIKTKNWLVNDANLVFYVDQATSSLLTSANNDIPLRVSLYDTKTNEPITDLINDSSADKSIYGGIIDKSNGTVKYKIRVTNYIRNLIKNGGEDIRLGLFVPNTITNILFSSNVNLPKFITPIPKFDNRIWNNLSVIEQNSYYFPNSSIINPLGTVLYSNTNNVPQDRKLKLEIWYSKPN